MGIQRNHGQAASAVSPIFKGGKEGGEGEGREEKRGGGRSRECKDRKEERKGKKEKGREGDGERGGKEKKGTEKRVGEGRGGESQGEEISLS